VFELIDNIACQLYVKIEEFRTKEAKAKNTDHKNETEKTLF